MSFCSLWLRLTNGKLGSTYFIPFSIGYARRTVLTKSYRVREEPSRTFTGHISVTILELSLVLHYRRNMLLCSTCCGVPVYSNTPTTPCRNCDKPLSLFINPKIIGTLVDETGCIAPGKLLWSERAWEQLLGRSKAEMCEMKGEEIRWLEQRMAFMRMHLVVGWEEGVGRLAVLGMRA